jgi:NAD-dependent dihydropyrimidine dehydrogenase PreA subunit
MRVIDEGIFSRVSTHLMIGNRRKEVIGHVIFRNPGRGIKSLLLKESGDDAKDPVEINEIWLAERYRGRLEGRVLRFFEKFARDRGRTSVVSGTSRPVEMAIYRSSGYEELQKGTRPVFYNFLGEWFRVPEHLRFVKYLLLLGGLVMPIIIGWTFLEWLTPLSVLPRAFSPVWGVTQGVVIGVSIFLFVIIVSVIEKRWWCRYVCPLGALLSLPAVRKILGIRLNEKRCIGCLKCERNCSMGIIDVRGQSGLRWDTECITCLACRDVCPKDAIGLDVRV